MHFYHDHWKRLTACLNQGQTTGVIMIFSCKLPSRLPQKAFTSKRTHLRVGRYVCILKGNRRREQTQCPFVCHAWHTR